MGYINSGIFKDQVLNHTYLGKKQFANNAGLTNLEIYNLIMSGREVLTPTADGILDVSITIYNTWLRGRNVIGYTYPNTPMQWISRRFFSVFDIKSISSNILHELLHKLNFDHDFKATARRPYSVPYGIGSMVASANMSKFYEHKEV